MRVPSSCEYRTLDQLDGALDGYVLRRGEQEMDVIRHDYEGVQRIAPFAAIVIKGLSSSRA